MSGAKLRLIVAIVLFFGWLAPIRLVVLDQSERSH